MWVIMLRPFIWVRGQWLWLPFVLLFLCDGASNNVAPNRQWFYLEQHCCWPNHDHTLSVADNFVSQRQCCLVAGGMWTTRGKNPSMLQLCNNLVIEAFSFTHSCGILEPIHTHKQ